MNQRVIFAGVQIVNKLFEEVLYIFLKLIVFHYQEITQRLRNHPIDVVLVKDLLRVFGKEVLNISHVLGEESYYFVDLGVVSVIGEFLHQVHNLRG